MKEEVEEVKEEVEEKKVGDEKEAKNNEFKKREIRKRAVTNLNLMKGERLKKNSFNFLAEK